MSLTSQNFHISMFLKTVDFHRIKCIVGVGFITIVIVLSRMHYNLESLSEKVKILFDFHNKRNEK